MNSLKKKLIPASFTFVTTIALTFSIIASTKVFGYAGGSVPSPASSGCAYTRYSTCYGAGWMKYSVNENPSGTTRLANGDLQVWGTGQGAGSGVIETTKCNDNGYYWRLAFYIDDYYFGSPTQASNGYWYNKNDQIGLMEVGWSHDYWMTIYNEADAYADWQKLDAESRRGYSWEGFDDRTSKLSWFCSEKKVVNTTVTWQSYSGVSLYNAASGGSAYNNSSAVTGWDSTNSSPVYEFNVNGTAAAYIEFDHYLKRDKVGPNGTTAQYKITGDGAPNTTQSAAGNTTGQNVYSNSSNRIKVTVGPEEEKTYCQTILHDGSKTFNSDGTQVGSTSNELGKSSKICITVKNIHLKESTVTWQSHSGVSLYSTKTGSTSLKSAVSDWDKENSATYEFNSGDTETAYIQFGHYLKRDLTTIPTSLKAKYKITGDDAPNKEEWSAGSTTGSNIYSSPERIKVSVGPGESKKYCQTAFHTGNKAFNKNGALDSNFLLDKSSKICITVKNIGSSMVYSSSNTSISGEYIAATDIKDKDHPTTKTTSTYNINLKNGPKTKNIIFWHNAYAASKNNTETPVIVRRRLETTLNNTTTKSNGFDSDRFDISYPYTGAQTYSANSTSYETSTIKTKFTTTTGSSPAYIANTRNYTDSQNNKFIHRDVYSIQFRSEGTFKFCETISVGGNEITTACAVVNVVEDTSACPEWLPTSYTNSGLYEGTTTTVSGVKNTTLVGKNGTYTLSNGNNFNSKPVWAKPGDVINWRHCYFPGVQKVAWAKATKNGREYSMYDPIFGTWENKWKVENEQLATNNAYDSGDLSYGIATVRDWNDEYTVETGQRSRAGLSLTETSSSGIPSYAKVTNKVGTRDNTPVTDKVMVKVPYNFTNSATVQLDGDAVYAGETAKIADGNIIVNTRYNATTKGTYATIVKNADVRLYAYTSSSNSGDAITNYSANSKNTGVLCDAPLNYTHGNCDEIDQSTNTINSPESTSGTSLDRFTGRSYNVYDVPAGEYYCVRIAIYPSTSGTDTNMSESGSDTWYISKPSCLQIAKKPSLQIWGSSLYSNGKIATTDTKKNNINGFYSYSVDNSNTTVFGSWVEQSIISRSSQISGLASGASTGYFGTDKQQRTPKKNLGGSYEGNSATLCLRSPLTIPKYPCNPDDITSGASTYSKPSDKSALISIFAKNASDSTDFIYEQAESKEIGNIEVQIGETRIIHSTGTVTITDNITYVEGEGYTTLEEIPKLIIYAEHDINIQCNVQYIYAVLIAEGDVNTCSNESKSNHTAAMNSNQLKIVGSVIADKILPYRTYGAASGIYNPDNATQTNGKLPDYELPKDSYTAVIPAEIIDYDTSLYLWGSPRASIDDSGKLDITYQAELAPRF